MFIIAMLKIIPLITSHKLILPSETKSSLFFMHSLDSPNGYNNNLGQAENKSAIPGQRYAPEVSLF